MATVATTLLDEEMERLLPPTAESRCFASRETILLSFLCGWAAMDMDPDQL